MKGLNINSILIIIQLIVSILLVTVILIQGKGVGLSNVFGGTGNIYRTKRGFEKILHVFTIILAALFLGIGFLNLLI